MGVEVKGAGDGVVIADRGCNDLGYKTNSDIRDSRDQMGAGFNRVMDRLCHRLLASIE